MHPVTIENGDVAMQVWPRIGGKISSMIDKADRFELLATYPAELPDTPHYDEPYADHWFGGWDECFPAVAPSLYPRHPYKGIAVPDHGELWGIPATTTVPTKDGITTVWHGLRFGYRLTRKLYLQGPAIIAEYSLSNLSPFEFQFVWAMNPLMSLASPVQLDGGGATAYRVHHDAEDKNIDVPFTWPTAATGENFSDPHTLPDRKGWKIYSSDPIQKPFVITYPNRKRSVRLEYASEDGLPAYWGVWINTGGWAANRHFAVQPTTGRYDQIDRSMKDGSAGRVEAFGRRDWSVRLVLQ